MKVNVIIKQLGKINNRSWGQVGIKCSQCATFYPSYYTHDKIEKRRAKLKKIKQPGKLTAERQRIEQYHNLTQIQAAKLFE